MLETEKLSRLENVHILDTVLVKIMEYLAVGSFAFAFVFVGPFTCSGKQDGTYADPADCTKYYQCYGGVKYSYTCPNGLNFNPKIKACDWPANTQC